MNEMEVKILTIDVDEIIKKLENLGLTRVKDESQINTIYDFEDLRLLSKKGYARIREVTDRKTSLKKTYMTVKTMLSQDKYKQMEENETLIEDEEAGHGILKALGLKVRKLLIKDRISYRYGSSLIEIDMVKDSPYPFPLMEIESGNEDELKKIVELLGYTMEDTTSMTMTEIIRAKEQRDKSFKAD